MLKFNNFFLKHIRELEYEHFVLFFSTDSTTSGKINHSFHNKERGSMTMCVIENVMHMDDVGHVKK